MRLEFAPDSIKHDKASIGPHIDEQSIFSDPPDQVNRYDIAFLGVILIISLDLYLKINEYIRRKNSDF